MPLFFGFLSLFSLLIFRFSEQFGLFGNIGWGALLFILFIRPLADIFPKGNIFGQLMFLRKGLGIFAGAFILAHCIGFFLVKGVPVIPGIFYAKYWNLSNLFGWGVIGFFITIPLLVTSNTWSMKKLGKNWKLLQRLSYLLFFVSAIHIALALHNWYPIILVALWLVCWSFAWRKRRKRMISSDSP